MLWAKQLQALEEPKNIFYKHHSYYLFHQGNGVIIVNRAIYMSSLHEIINDMSKFLKLPSDPTIGREGKLQRFLSTLNKKGFF